MVMNSSPFSDKILTADQALELLAPYLPDVAACLNAGWRRWRELCETLPEVGLEMSKRGRAAIVYDATAAEARRRFRNKPGINLIDTGGLFLVDFEGQLTLRFKKFGRGLLTSNIPTRQQQLFDWQQPLPGMPAKSTQVVAGYLLDSLEVRVARQAITCREGPALRWAFDIPDFDEQPLPLPAPADEGPRRPVVRPIVTEEGVDAQ